jgi:hypothetical protein
MDYRHTQTGSVIISAMGIVIIVAMIPLFVMDTPQPVNIVAILLFIIGLGLFYSLTVEINNGILKCSFGAGVIRRYIPISEIEQATSVRNPWYSGWGIRWRPGQYLMWNVSGRLAVEMTLKGGRRFRVGTDEPEALVAAIRANKTGRS